MENNVFPAPEVSGVLTREFIESRLHTDHPDDALQERNIELQDELQGNRATPYYLVMDPQTGETLATFAGADFRTERFRAFLLSGVQAKEALRVASVDR